MIEHKTDQLVVNYAAAQFLISSPKISSIIFNPPFWRDSDEVIGTQVDWARRAVARNGGKYAPSTSKIAALYRPIVDFMVSGSQHYTRTRGSQHCICRNVPPTAGAVMCKIYQTICWGAIPALDWISSKTEGIPRYWIVPDPEDLSGCFPSKRTKIMERCVSVTAYQAVNSFIQPCSKFVCSSKMDLSMGDNMKSVDNLWMAYFLIWWINIVH